jgi:hypothetical protein
MLNRLVKQIVFSIETFANILIMLNKKRYVKKITQKDPHHEQAEG